MRFICQQGLCLAVTVNVYVSGKGSPSRPHKKPVLSLSPKPHQLIAPLFVRLVDFSRS